MEIIIKKAIEGGYPYGYIETNNDGTWYTERDDILNVKHQYELVCDPLFFKVLGKSCGWKEIVCSFCGTEVTRPGNSLRDGWCNCDMKSTKAKSGWEYHALRFHEINLTEGWGKGVEYLEDLITK